MSLAAAGIFYFLQQTAVQRQNVAVSRLLITESGTLADTDPVRSKLLSIAAWRINPSKEARYAMLAAAALPGIGILTGHTDKVASVAFSPDGATLASGSTMIRCGCGTWRPTGRSAARSPATADRVNSVAFSPDGKTVASGSDDGTVILWDVATGQEIGNPLTGHAGVVYSVAFSPGGRTLAAGDGDGTVILWNVATGQEIGPTRSPATRTQSPRWHSARTERPWPAASTDGTVRLWDVATDRPIGGPLTGHAGGVFAVAFSPDGKTLASGNSDGTITLWNVATDRPIGGPLTGHAGGSPRWRSARTARPWPPATATAQSACGTWPPAGRSGPAHRPRRPGRLGGVQPGRQDPGQWQRRRHGAVVGRGRRPAIGTPLTRDLGYVASVAFSPDGKTLAAGGSDGTITLWNVATGRQIGTRSPATPAGSPRWRSARTARPWPAAAMPPTTRSGCGTWPPASRSASARRPPR